MTPKQRARALAERLLALASEALEIAAQLPDGEAITGKAPGVYAPKKHWPDADRERCHELFRLGKTNEEIGEILDRTPTSIRSERSKWSRGVER